MKGSAVIKSAISSIPFRVILFWLLLSLAGAAISGALAEYWAVRPYISTRVLIVCLVSNFCGYLVFLFTWTAAGSDWIKQNLNPFFDPLVKNHFIGALVASAGVTIFCILCFALMFDGKEGRNIFIVLMNNPGGLFAILSGVASFVGIYVTLQSVLDIRQTITTLPQLVDRVCALLDQTKLAASEGERIRVLAYTPLMGSVLLVDRDWKRLREKLNLCDNQVEIICLDTQSVAQLHQLSSGRLSDQGTIEASTINDMNKAVENILDHNSFAQSKRKSAARMPHYFLFANDRRAIIALPVFFPLPTDHLEPGVIGKFPPVQIFGFETSDSGVVRSVIQAFEIYRDSVPDD